MKKYLIEWHEECLKNAIRTTAEREKVALRLQREVEQSQKENEFYSYQIDLARRKGLVMFDRDKLGIKRKAKK